MRGFWKCQRQSGGVKCGASNPTRVRKCQKCLKPRPPRKRPAHMSALDVAYTHYVTVNGGEHCGICGKPPEPGKRHHRDHEHKGVGKPRGILCFRCNAALRPYMDLAWVRAAAEYLQRTEAA